MPPNLDRVAQLLGFRKPEPPQPLWVNSQSTPAVARPNNSVLYNTIFGAPKAAQSLFVDAAKQTGKGLNVIGQATDDVFGLPGQAITGFDKNVPTGFSQQVGGATERVTGSKYAGLAAGLVAGFAEPFPGPKGGKALVPAAKKTFQGLAKLSTKINSISKSFSRGWESLG